MATDDTLPTGSNVPAPGSTPTPPTTIGPYRILEPLGAGGFGVVYLAEQTSPVKRRVALKLIKPGMDSQAVIARFEAERQALAVMDHPCIAKVLDAGTTDRGLPYFVMEHVRGETITTFADRNRLSIDDRINLIIRVCEAVQHAHTKGVVHRDLKPSNILVAYDAEGLPSPKVIDFGVAKALNTRLSEHTIFTHQGQLIGTPEYMSPEQAEMSGLDIDTRADIYSLGALLYELLTGALPFDSATLRNAAFTEVQRIIREVEPPKPSTKLTHLTTATNPHPNQKTRHDENQQPPTPRIPASSSIAHDRRTSLPHLHKLLSRDLDWVVMKCLEKDRARRYDTTHALALDLQRYLADEPVLAGPPSPIHRCRKFLRRHRNATTAAAIITLVLIAATVVSIGFALSEAEQRRRANAQRAEAQRQASMATQTRAFLIDEIFDKAAPEFLGPLSPALDLVEAASEALSSKTDIDPELRASLNHDIAMIFLRMEKPALAEPHARNAYQWRSENYDPANPLSLETTNNLALVLKKRAKYQDADRLFENLLELLENTPDSDPLFIAQVQHNLAIDKRKLGDIQAADHLSATALKAREQLLGDTDPATLNTLTSRANLLREMNRLPEAESLARRALDARRELFGPEHSHTLNSIHALARILAQQGNHDEAVRLYANNIHIAETRFGQDAIPVAIFRREYGKSLTALARFDEAQDQLLRALTIAESRMGPTNPPAPPTNPKLIDYIDPLINLYDRWNQPDKHAKWTSRRNALVPPQDTEN